MSIMIVHSLIWVVNEYNDYSEFTMGCSFKIRRFFCFLFFVLFWRLPSSGFYMGKNTVHTTILKVQGE